MRREIPAAVIAVVADLAAEVETHATLDSLFLYAGGPGDPPQGSKQAKALEWLRNVNRNEEVTEPLCVLGRLIEGYMEGVPKPHSWGEENILEGKKRIEEILTRTGLGYIKGGRIVVRGVASPSRTLEKMIRDTDYTSINEEFNRALVSIETSPRDAVSAACNILESICKTYIEDEGLEMPSKQDLKHVWSVVRKNLGIDHSIIEDRDLQEILSGIFAVVNGIGALRTHASSAHGFGKKMYKLEPRHARLAVHSAHTLALFILESWEKKKTA